MQTPNTNEEPGHRPNLDYIIDLPCFYLAKVVAMKIKESGYASVGKFFSNVPQSDLETILDKFSQLENTKLERDDMINRYADLTLLAMVLGYGEGKESFSSEELDLAIQNLRRLSIVTAFDRKGRCVAQYDKFSVIEPWNNSLYVEAKNAS